jgi:hypothetical protein
MLFYKNKIYVTSTCPALQPIATRGVTHFNSSITTQNKIKKFYILFDN